MNGFGEIVRNDHLWAKMTAKRGTNTNKPSFRWSEDKNIILRLDFDTLAKITIYGSK